MEKGACWKELEAALSIDTKKAKQKRSKSDEE